MPRTTTIAIDTSEAIAPSEWSVEWVQHRLIFAYSVERRLPQSRHRPIASAWPVMKVEFSDIVGRADDARDKVFQSWEYAGLGVSAEDITRMEQAHDWLRIILAPHPLERQCLSQWAAAVAYRLSLRQLLARRRWARSTFYRHVGAGAHVIALELKRQGRPVV
jgi:hypothetical protein